ncbi:MAG: TetR/AcrR family transcriptional regulator [Alphaproteobacteria bacterium]
MPHVKIAPDLNLQSGRIAQKQRTRRKIIDGAIRLMAAGMVPSMEQIAAEAGVSRATAYRYFPNSDFLMAEAALDVGMPLADEVLAGQDGASVEQRVAIVDQLFHDMFTVNEPLMRLMLSEGHKLRAHDPDHKTPIRQGRRMPLIAAALAGHEGALDPAMADRLTKALSLIIGPEGMIVTMDVLGIGDDEARALKQWMIATLIGAARDAS